MNNTMRSTLAGLALMLPLAAPAQTVPAPASSTATPMAAMPGMPPAHAGHATPAASANHGKHAQHAGHGLHAEHAQHGKPAAKAAMHDMRDMQGHDMHAMPIPAAAAEHAGHATPAMDHATHDAQQPMSHDAHDMHAMPMPPAAEHAGHTMPAMDHAAHGMQQPMSHDAHDMSGMHDMSDMRMQGGAAPADARSADYSDGIGHGDMPGMVMIDKQSLGMLRLDRLEAFSGRHQHGQAWEGQAWYGSDLNRLSLRSEGEREGGKGEGDIEAMWSHAASAYWDTQLGLRHDFGGGPTRQWLGFGVQGLAPYWFELEATAYVGAAGRSALRLRGEYELLLTQRLILQPELEANLYGKADRARGIGAGLADASFGLRLRYEFRRQFAPYLGVVWTQRYGGSADAARAAGHAAFDRQVVAGFRLWF